MCSLNVDSFFTNIPLEETISICATFLKNFFCFDEGVIESIHKSEFKNLLSLAIQELYFMFNNIPYKQKNGVTMGSPFEPTIANVFLTFYDAKWLEQYPNEFKPAFLQKIY